MRVVALITWTDCENKYRSLQSLGHEVHTLQYDSLPHDRHGELVEQARALDPDFILFIGAVEKYHARPVPRPDVLKRFRDVAPTIHMCDDAGDEPWWEWLETYSREKCFDVQVSIDGSHESPHRLYPDGMVLLTPIDPRPFRPRRWDERDIACGMVGGLGHGERAVTIQHLQQRGLIDFRVGPHGRSYDDTAEIMCRTKLTFCHPMTGSGQRFHVKGRVVEAGFACSALLERKGSPTSRWFTPGVEYLEYENPSHAEHLIRTTPDEDLREKAARLHSHVVSLHHPRVFWDKVLRKAGVRSRRVA